MWEFFMIFAVILTVLYVCRRQKQEKKDGERKFVDTLLEKSDVSDVFGHDLIDMAT